MDDPISRYFSSLNNISKSIFNQFQDIILSYGDNWNNLDLKEQEEIIDSYFINPELEKRYGGYEDKLDSDKYSDYFPILKINSGEKIVVDFEHDELGWTWRDEHSGPFSWKSRSQQDLTLGDIEELSNTQLKKRSVTTKWNHSNSAHLERLNSIGNDSTNNNINEVNSQAKNEVEMMFEKFRLNNKTDEQIGIKSKENGEMVENEKKDNFIFNASSRSQDKSFANIKISNLEDNINFCKSNKSDNNLLSNNKNNQLKNIKNNQQKKGSDYQLLTNQQKFKNNQNSEFTLTNDIKNIIGIKYDQALTGKENLNSSNLIPADKSLKNNNNITATNGGLFNKVFVLTDEKEEDINKISLDSSNKLNAYDQLDYSNKFINNQYENVNNNRNYYQNGNINHKKSSKDCENYLNDEKKVIQKFTGFNELNLVNSADSLENSEKNNDFIQLESHHGKKQDVCTEIKKTGFDFLDNW